VIIEYSLQPEPDSAGMRVSLVHMAVVEIDGVPVHATLNDRVSAAFRLPDFVVDTMGVQAGVVGLEELIEDFDRILPGAAATITPEAIAQLEDTVLSKYWGTWVGFWAGLGAVDERQADFEVSLPGAAGITSSVVVETLARASGEARLRYVETIEGEAFSRAVGDVHELLGGTASLDDAAIDGRRTTTAEVTTDPANLRPRAASLVIDVEVTDADGMSASSRESHDWQFAWEDGDCD
jgi:hypothetical protein